jgi:hypothetical protein
MTKVFLGVGVTLLLMLTFVGHAKAVALKRGDILVADASAVGGAGAVIRVDPLTGAQTVVSSGGLFVRPFDLTIDAAGQILVVDTEAFGGSLGIIRVDPVSGVQTVIYNSSGGGPIQGPEGIVIHD